MEPKELIESKKPKELMKSKKTQGTHGMQGN
jgi:hypothetical protein